MSALSGFLEAPFAFKLTVVVLKTGDDRQAKGRLLAKIYGVSGLYNFSQFLVGG